jgi:hypothetical protein
MGKVHRSYDLGTPVSGMPRPENSSPCGVDLSTGTPPETLTPALPLRGGGRSGFGISG